MTTCRTLEEFLSEIGRSQRREWEKEIRGLRTPTDVRHWARRARRWIVAGHGGFPERTPLKARTVGVIRRRGYRVEKMLFESRPRYFVPALVHVPEGVRSPFPAVVQCCGHYAEAKAHPDYQCMAILLALNGFVVCSPDPIGQGERGEYADCECGANVAGDAVAAHHFVYKPSLLLGRNLIHFRSWDKIRTIDLLCEREDVDSSRIGFIGHSGGGQMTYLLCGLDSRIKAASISSGSGSCEHPHFRPDVRNARCISDNLDYVASHIPKPLQIMIGKTEQVYLDRLAGHRHLFERLYGIFGKSDRFRVVINEGDHDLDEARRTLVAQWLVRWLCPAADFEPHECSPEPVPRLHCTETGNTCTSLPTETAVGLNTKALKRLRRKHSAPQTSKELRTDQAHFRRRLRRLLALPEERGPLSLKRQRAGGGVEDISFKGEPGRRTHARLYLPTQSDPPSPCLICLNERGTDGRATDFEQLRGSCPGMAILAVHPAGLGEDVQLPIGKRDHPMLWSADTNLATLAAKVGRPLMGIRVNDVCRTVDAIGKHRLLDAHRVFVFGSGSAALRAVCAAALDLRIRGVVVAGLLLSYAQLVTNRSIAGTYPADYIPGILKHGDVAGILACIAPRPLAVSGTLDHLGNCADAGAQRKALSTTRRCYRIAGSPQCLEVDTEGAGDPTPAIALIAKWLGIPTEAAEPTPVSRRPSPERRR